MMKITKENRVSYQNLITLSKQSSQHDHYYSNLRLQLTSPTFFMVMASNAQHDAHSIRERGDLFGAVKQAPPDSSGDLIDPLRVENGNTDSAANTNSSNSHEK